MKKKTISICIPCYNEEENIPIIYRLLRKITDGLTAYRFEYVFVSNGSTDRTTSVISGLARENRNVVGIFLTRNFGPEASIYAALDHVTSDAVILIAADMQEPPELIPEFIHWWDKGYDLVLGTYRNETDNPIMTALRRSFYLLFRVVSSIEVPVNNTGFGLMSRRVVDTIQSLPESYRFFRGLRAWIGYPIKYIPYMKQERLHGKSAYNLYSYLRFSERSVLALSSLPLDFIMNFSFMIGIACFPLGLLGMAFHVGGMLGTVAGLFFVWIAGLLLISVSLVGKYIQVIFEETKHRPQYVIRNILNGKR